MESAVAARQVRWESAGAHWEFAPRKLLDGRPTSKPSASVRIETSVGAAELTIWTSGEADLSHLRLPDDGSEVVVDTYELTSVLGLNGCLDDLERHVGIAE